MIRSLARSKPLFRPFGNRGLSGSQAPGVCRAMVEVSEPGNAFDEMPLQGKRVTIVGMGELGSAPAKLARLCSASAVGETDHPTSSQGRDMLVNSDTIIARPDLPAPLPQSPGSEVISEAEFAARLLPHSVQCIGVSSALGKTCTVHFVAQLLRSNGCFPRPVDAREEPLSETVLSMRREHCRAPFTHLIVETDGESNALRSIDFRLANVPSMRLCAACVDSHWQEREGEFCERVEAGGLIISLSVPSSPDSCSGRNLAAFGELPGARRVSETGGEMAFELRVPGKEEVMTIDLSVARLVYRHLIEDAAVACLITKWLLPEADLTERTLSRLVTPEHRMEHFYPLIRFPHSFAGVDAMRVPCIDDAACSSAGAAKRAIEAVTTPSVVLLGGKVKSGDVGEFTRLVELLRNHVGAVVFGEDGQRIVKELAPEVHSLRVEQRSTLAEAFAAAVNILRDHEANDLLAPSHGEERRFARCGIILTPGCEWADQYQAMESRAADFLHLIDLYAAE